MDECRVSVASHLNLMHGCQIDIQVLALKAGQNGSTFRFLAAEKLRPACGQLLWFWGQIEEMKRFKIYRVDRVNVALEMD